MKTSSWRFVILAAFLCSFGVVFGCVLPATVFVGREDLNVTAWADFMLASALFIIAIPLAAILFRWRK